MSLETEAKNITKNKKTNNTIGLEDKFYTKEKNSFPILFPKPQTKEKNIIFKDLQVLLELLKTYKNKPLFVFTDLNPYVYKNKNIVSPIFEKARKEVEKYGFEYFNLWTEKKEDFDSYMLEDGMHLSENAWLQINKKIIEHFMEVEK